MKNVEFLRFNDVQIDTATGAETVVGQHPSTWRSRLRR